MTFADQLRALSLEDLAAVFRHRPEAARLGAPAFGDLAAALAARHGLMRSIATLDRFLADVLGLACVEDGPLRASRAAEEGLPAADFARAAKSLSRRALAFPSGRGKTMRVEVPACVRECVVNPLGLGVRFAVLSETLNVTELRLVGSALGLEAAALSINRAQILEQITTVLSSSAVIQPLLKNAPRRAKALFDRIRAAGGTVSGETLIDGNRLLATTTPGRQEWYRERVADDEALNWLQRHALVLRPSKAYGYNAYERLIAIPAEVERALRERAVTNWQTQPPVIATHPLVGEPSPDDILADMEMLLDVWDANPPPALQRGGLGTREIARAAKTLETTEHRVGVAYAIAVSADLVGVTETHSTKKVGRRTYPEIKEFIAPAKEALAWREQTPAHRWWTLWSSAITTPLLDERLGGVIAPDRIGYDGFALTIRRAILDALARQPEGESVSPGDLANVLGWRHPTLFPHGAESWIGVAGTWLEVMGAGTAGERIGLTPIGRAALAGVPVEELEQYFPARTESLSVQADLTIIVPGRPSASLASALHRFADPTSARPAWIYRLSRESIRRGLDASMTVADMLKVLETHASSPVPQVVESLLHDTDAGHGRLIVGSASHYVRSDDPALIASIVASRKLKGLQARMLTPHVAVIEGKSVDRILLALRGAGFMPLAENGSASDSSGDHDGDHNGVEGGIEGSIEGGMHRLVRSMNIAGAPRRTDPPSHAEALSRARAVRAAKEDEEWRVVK